MVQKATTVIMTEGMMLVVNTYVHAVSECGSKKCHGDGFPTVIITLP